MMAPMTASQAVMTPAFVNPDAGRGRAALDALSGAAGFAVHRLPPDRLAGALGETVSQAVPRVLVAGGDGTVALAASVLAGTATALAVLPAGTLNHFARDHGLPINPEQAIQLAREGTPRAVDVGY